MLWNTRYLGAAVAALRGGSEHAGEVAGRFVGAVSRAARDAAREFRNGRAR